MIVVQDLDKGVLEVYTTLYGFLESNFNKPDSKYEYLRDKLAKSKGETIKYKGFYLTKRIPVKGKRNKNRFNKLKHNRFSIG